MREYDVAESWTKLFNLKVSNLPNERYYLRPILVMETGTFLYKWTYTCGRGVDYKLIRSGHEEEKLETYMFTRDRPDMIEYEESLLSLG
ncbi:hypothetical protein RchiOBHm_Chr5g0059301 [Rosa chinensis]|uniref:Uncharacterized protein n=1 Tax=Rosa chinensis TaxID=74649 RepID=A0A2P6QHF2_ROSCH|nr:hypothetical protein RchiOBHm_Chr5g0059301 [Rosa chinensis]